MPPTLSDDEPYAEAQAPVPLTRTLVEPRLSVLGRNPFTQAHVCTTATLVGLRLQDLNALSEFPYLQHVDCSGNAISSLAPLQHLPLLLSVDASNNQLSEVLDFETPRCTPSNAWVGGGKWIGSLLRVANLSHNRIERMGELSASHQFLQELHLAHNGICVIEGVSRLRFLRVLDLSHNRLTSTKGLVATTAAKIGVSESSKSLTALEKLVLSHNHIEAVDEVALLPRLEHLDLAHNNVTKLNSIGSCQRLQQLDLSSNDLEDVNELNHLISLRFLQRLALHGCPLVEHEDSQVFYRARVLRRLLQLRRLDDDDVTAKEKVKALVMHGSDVESRQRVFAKYLPGQQFTNFLPPLEFDDDDELERFCERMAETQQLSGYETLEPEQLADTSSS